MGGSRLKDPLPEKDPLAVKDPLLKDALLKEGSRPALVLGSLMPMSAEEALVVAMLGYLRYSVCEMCDTLQGECDAQSVYWVKAVVQGGTPRINIRVHHSNR
jgi:hypothetical protein